MSEVTAASAATVKNHSQFLPSTIKQAFQNELPQLLEIIEKLAGGGLNEKHIQGLTNPSVKCLLLASLLEKTQKPVVVFTTDVVSSNRMYRDLIELLPEEQLAIWPAEDFSPYDLSHIPVQTVKEQYLIGQDLIAQHPKIYLLPARSLALKHVAPSVYQQKAIVLNVEDECPPQQLANQLLEAGYQKTSIILEPGEFSWRGDIFDIYPVQAEPVRVEFFGDTIETIRIINPETQRSVENVKQASAIPRHPFVLNESTLKDLTQKIWAQYDQQAKRLSDVEVEALKATLEGQLQAISGESFLFPDGFDFYTALVETQLETVLPIIPEGALLVIDDWQQMDNYLQGYCDRLDRQLKEGVEKGRLLNLECAYHLTAEAALAQLKQPQLHRLYLNPFPLVELNEDLNAQQLAIEIVAPDNFKADMQALATKLQTWRREGYQIFIGTDNPQRVLDNCKEWDVAAVYLTEQASPEKLQQSLLTKDVIISKSNLVEGFVLPEAQLIYLTDAELFNRKRKKVAVLSTSARKRDDVEVIKAIDELREGDYVVHYKHGIGQFEKLTKITIDKETREYLTVKYAGQDRLHVPVEQVNLLSRYRGSGDNAPKLNKMGGIDWGKTKSKAEKAIRSIARELTELYATRAQVRGYQFEPDTPWQVEMEEAFPFTETPDQWNAIVDIKNDMESENPMDRLVCGDVGYGKTEVAIRAIFKAVLSGKQVVVLVPTTILAQQHFNTISDRFKPFPMKVGLMSRFRSPKEQKEVLNRLAVGECDVVVGTHRLLQKDVHFKDLGLVVVDEEHRFGVSHKEKLKQLRKNVDFLTMSATPIPRTLHMSLSGIRQMSLINTPPVNRLPIKTFVGPYNPAQVRMAVLQEVDRGGQVYFLHNRVQTIYQMQAHLQDLIPEVSIGVGHGQMNEHDLENVMLDFAQGTYQVLLCTTIIESGLDIPTANTMIVDRADRFGLAQLYQIRGRVGRSDVQAYSYMYYEPDQILTQDAQQRLRAIREFTQLGSGYQIALRDMEIRGVGNVLGSEQHGHMIAIGFDLYCEMLKENIDALQGKIVEHQQDSIVDLNVTALIPDSWIDDKNVKLTEYKRLADVKSERALEIIQSEWKDRFGELPEETLRLTQLVKIRILATELGFFTIREDDSFLRIHVPYGLQEWMGYQAKLKPEYGKVCRWMPASNTGGGREAGQPVLTIRHISIGQFDKLDFVENLLRQLKQLSQVIATTT